MYFINSKRPTNQRRSGPSLMEWTPPDPRRQNGPGRKSARRVRSPHPAHIGARWGGVHSIATGRRNPGQEVPLGLLAAASLPTPGRGIGNPTAEEHVETVGTRLRGEGSCRVRLRQVAQDGPHLSV